MTIRKQAWGLAFSVVMMTGLAADQAEAQSACNSGAKVLTALWDQWGKELAQMKCKGSQDCLSNASKMEQITRDVVKFWNEQAQNSWATIGPRQLLEGTMLDGKVVMGGSRLFVTPVPADGSVYEIEVLKEGGGEATVTASLFDGATCLSRGQTTFAKTAKNGTRQKVTATDALGKLVVVKVDAKRGAFDYKLTMRKVK